MKHRCALAPLILLLTAIPSPAQVLLFEESFDSEGLNARGWYDNTALVLSDSVHRQGGRSSAEFFFRKGDRTPTSGGGTRRKFAGSEGVYLSYWVRYSENWTGSNKPYHPHEFHFVTNVDPDYIGPAYTHLTLYIEQNEGRPMLSIQDAVNIDESRIGEDLTAVTEERAVAGCNGDSDGHGAGDCYRSGTTHRNGKSWKVPEQYFSDTPGTHYKSDWHHVEAYFKLNSVAGEKGVADGVIQYWYDGELLIDHHDVMLRTGEHPAMKFNQFLIAPYIGDGSPVDQTMWVDDIVVATSPVPTTSPRRITPPDSTRNHPLPVTFRWHPVVGADWYTFHLYTLDETGMPAIAANDSVADTVYTATSLLDTSTFYWMVIPMNDAIAGGEPYSRPWQFTTGLSSGVDEPTTREIFLSIESPVHTTGVARIRLKAPEDVELDLFDVMGSNVQSLFSGWMNAGENVVNFDVAGLASGVYICRLSVGDREVVEKIVVR